MTRYSRTLRLLTALLLSTGALVAQQIPRSRHVYIVAEENTSYEHEVGSANMPYLNSLIKQGALATQFYANQHSSLPDYFWVTAGQVMTENNDTLATFDVDNIVRHVMQLGLTYKSYAESLPYAGYAGLYSGAYMKRHAPLPYYTDMGNSTTEMLKHVPITNFVNDVKNGTLPNFAFITPSADDDMHNCPSGEAACEQQADNWLKTYIAPLLARPEFQPGGDGLLILWADEADLSIDNRCSATVTQGCGGRILVAMIGPNVKKGYQSVQTYHHENVLRTMLEALGTTSNFPAASQTSVPMSEMFIGSGISYGVTVSSPGNNTTVGSPMQVTASATAAHPVTAMQIYVDSKLAYSAAGNSVNTQLNVATGKHYVVVQSWDSSGAVQKRGVNVTVGSTTTNGVTISTPTNGAAVSSPMQVMAKAMAANPITRMQIYVDNTLAYNVAGSTINTTLTMVSGTHNVVVQSWDSAGGVQKKAVTVTVATQQAITITSPSQGATITGGEVNVVASSNVPSQIVASAVYIDNVEKFSTASASVSTHLPVSTGSHRIVVQNWDTKGNVTKASVSITAK